MHWNFLNLYLIPRRPPHVVFYIRASRVVYFDTCILLQQWIVALPRTPHTVADADPLAIRGPPDPVIALPADSH